MINQQYIGLIILSILLVIATSLAIYYGYKYNNKSCEDVANKALLEADRRANAIYESIPELLQTYKLTPEQLNTSTGIDNLASTTLTDAQLLDPYYNNEKALYTADLVNLAYYIGRNFTYATNGTAAKEWVQKQLGPGLTCLEVFGYTVDNLDFINWFTSYGALLLKQTLVGGGDYYFLAFRGTIYYSEWIEDAKVALTSVPYFPSSSKVFTGFNNVYNNYANPGVAISLRNQIRNALVKYNVKSSKGLTIAGHSLGSALAMITAIDVVNSTAIDVNKMDFYGCATPAMTNLSASQLLKSKRLFTVQNTKDVVALSSASESSLSKLIGLRVTPHNSCCFTGDSINPSISHSLYTYIGAMTTFGSLWVTKSRSGTTTQLGEVCSL